MAVVLMESFDHYATADRQYKSVASDVNDTFGDWGRCSSQAYRNNTFGGTRNYDFENPTENEWHQFGFAAQWPLSIGSTTVALKDRYGQVLAFVVPIAPNGLSVWSGPNTILGTKHCESLNILAIGTTWYYIEVRIRQHDTLGEVYLYLDGNLEDSVTGVDTNPGDNGAYVPEDFASMLSITPAGFNTTIDDVYVEDGTGTAPTNASEAHSDVSIMVLQPETDAVAAGDNGVMTASSGSDLGAMVDDVLPDNDTTYLEGDVVGEQLLHFPDIVQADATTLYAVQVSSLVKQEAVGNGLFWQAAARPVPSGTTYLKSESWGVPSENYTYRRDVWDKNPNGDAAWTVGTFNATQWGGKLVLA